MMRNLVPITVFIAAGIMVEIEPAPVTPIKVSRLNASSRVLVGEVCHVTNT